MLMVMPVYGTDRQSQRKLSPREGGDCTHSATCPQHTHKLSSFLYPVLWGILGGLRWGSWSRGAERSPDSWHTATAALLQSPWLVTHSVNSGLGFLSFPEIAL